MGCERMKKIKGLNVGQKGILLGMLAMALVFSVVYPLTISRVGFEYRDKIFVPSQENGDTVYSGKLQGQTARFTVSADKTVVFQRGEKTYGPYTAKEDPTAIPKDEAMAAYMTGMEIRQGEDILFRGGVLELDDFDWLYREDGSIVHSAGSYVVGDGVERDENGDPIDTAAPSVADIVELARGPELTHKGTWLAWFGAVLICVLNAVLILFADELFHWRLAIYVRDAEQAEPSDWEIKERYIGWTVLAVMALILFLVGLR